MPPLWFGGSFNPIHHGHLICARAIAEAGGYDKVILIPSAQPPHKQDVTDLAPAKDRLAMCRAAVAGSRIFAVDDLEIRRSGPSYTIDTAREIFARTGDPVHWLIGADMLLLLPKWHDIAALLVEVRFVIMGRPGSGFDWTTLGPALRPLEANVVPSPQVDISATDIRRRVAAGKSIDYLVPPAVAEYIAQRGLYTGRRPGQ